MPYIKSIPNQDPKGAPVASSSFTHPPPQYHAINLTSSRFNHISHDVQEKPVHLL